MTLPLKQPPPHGSEPELIDSYQVVETLQQGPSIRACLAQDRETGADVLILLLLPAQHGDDADLQRAFRKATRMALQASARLSHPAILRAVARGFSDGRPYIAQEHASGLTLADCIEDGIVLNVDKIVEIFAEVADALAHAHTQHVVHGDLQLHHIILSRTGKVRVRNFAFMPVLRAPTEIARGEAPIAQHVGGELSLPDTSSDIHALGVSLHAMLTGRSRTRLQPKAIENANKVVLPPSAFNPDVPPALDALVLQAMHPDRKQRHESMSALADALHALRSAPTPKPEFGHTLSKPKPPGLAHPADTPRPPTEARREHGARGRGRGILVGVALACAIAGAWFVLSPWPPPSQMASPEMPAPVIEAPAPATPSAVLPWGESANVAAPASADAAADETRFDPATWPFTDLEGLADERALPTEADPSTPEAASSAGTASPDATPEQPALVGRVTFNVRPWGEVRVNGRSRGATPPLKMLELPQGTHRIEIRNADFAPHVTSVTINKGTSIVIRHRFQ